MSIKNTLNRIAKEGVKIIMNRETQLGCLTSRHVVGLVATTAWGAQARVYSFKFIRWLRVHQLIEGGNSSKFYINQIGFATI